MKNPAEKRASGDEKRKSVFFMPTSELTALAFEKFCHKGVMFYLGMILFAVGGFFSFITASSMSK